MTNEEYVRQMYISTMGHEADPEGLAYWTGKLDDGSLQQDGLQQAMVSAATSSDYSLVNDAYKKVFGRDGDQAGIDYWTKDLQDGKITPAQLEGAMQQAAVQDYGYAQNPETGFYGPQSYSSSGGGTTPPTGSGGPQTSVDPTGPAAGSDVNDLFQPTLFPTSGSQSTTGSTATSANESANQSTNQSLNTSTNQSVNQSSNESESFSGMPEWFSSDLLNNLLPELKGSFEDLPGQVDQWRDHNLAASRSAAKNLLDGNLTTMLADLAKRGLTGGSAMREGISDAAMTSAREMAGRDQTTMANANQMRMQIPGLLTNIAGLGQFSKGSSSGGSSGSSLGTSFGASSGQSTGSSSGSSDSSSSGQSTSQSADPLAPYQLYSNMLQGMM